MNTNIWHTECGTAHYKKYSSHINIISLQGQLVLAPLDHTTRRSRYLATGMIGDRAPQISDIPHEDHHCPGFDFDFTANHRSASVMEKSGGTAVTAGPTSLSSKFFLSMVSAILSLLRYPQFPFARPYFGAWNASMPGLSSISLPVGL